MPDLDLPAIKARYAAATKGPWTNTLIRDGHECSTVRVAGVTPSRPIASVITRAEFGHHGIIELQHLDTRFIAHSWSDIAALIAAVEAADTLCDCADAVEALDIGENWENLFNARRDYRLVRGEVQSG